jgi:hypothetical protein
MAMGLTEGLPKPREIMSGQAEHLEQCAEFPLLRNRGLGALAVTVLPIALARRGAATACAAGLVITV